MTRDPTINLPPHEWRCSSEPKKCNRAWLCARRLAAIPQGAPLADGALLAEMAAAHNPWNWVMGTTPDCNGYVQITRGKQ